MNRQKLIVILLALYLAGCAFNGSHRETTNLPDETVPFESTQFTETTAATEQTVPTQGQTIPTETQLPATDPTQTGTAPPQEILRPEPEDADFVKVRSYIPNVFVDLRYSTENNFTGQRIYGFDEVWLRYGTVKKLILVQEELKKEGLSLKLWDGFRPPSAQFKLWEVCPDPTYVSDPNAGFSSHSRGNTVDITVTHADGTELVMPTGFDDFSALADRDYSDCSREAAANALLLEEIMEKHGFKPYFGEWWHYTDTQSYPVEQEFEPICASLYYADCNEYISLRTKPSTAAEVITRIPVGEQFHAVARCGDFMLIVYEYLTGYVLSSYVQPVE